MDINSVLSQPDDAEERLRFDSVEKNENLRNGFESGAKGKVHDSHEKNISIPFFSGNLSLSQVQDMQRNARKTCLPVPLRKKPADESIDTSLCKDQFTPEPEYKKNLSEYCGKGIQASRENLMKTNSKKETFDRRRNFNSSKSSSFHVNRSLTDSMKQLKIADKSKPKIEDEGNWRKIGKQSSSYLEQYRRRQEMRRRNRSPDSQSNSSVRTICSASRLQISIGLSSTLRTDESEIDSNCDWFSSEEKLYSDILNCDMKTQLSAKSSFVSCKSSLGSNENETIKIPESHLPSKLLEVGGSKSNPGNNQTDLLTKRTKVTSLGKEANSSFSPSNPPIQIRPARSLGPDIESINPKLDALQKRNEYGNKMSYLNRDSQQHKQSSESNRTISSNEEDVVPIPITNYSLEDIDSSRLMKKTSSEVHKRKKRRNSMNRKPLPADLETSTNAKDVGMMIQRHQEEKKLAENIKNQLFRQN